MKLVGPSFNQRCVHAGKMIDTCACRSDCVCKESQCLQSDLWREANKQTAAARFDERKKLAATFKEWRSTCSRGWGSRAPPLAEQEVLDAVIELLERP